MNVNLDNLNTFLDELTAQYTVLFQIDPEYEYAKARNTPENLAAKMTTGFTKGSSNKDGKGIKNTCKKLGIPYTYKGISEYLHQPKG